MRCATPLTSHTSTLSDPGARASVASSPEVRCACAVQLTGSKWRGGVLNIALAKPDFKARLAAEATADAHKAADARISQKPDPLREATCEMRVRLASGQVITSAPGILVGSRRIIFPPRPALPLAQWQQGYHQQGAQAPSRVERDNALWDAACMKRLEAPRLDPAVFARIHNTSAVRASDRLSTECPVDVRHTATVIWTQNITTHKEHIAAVARCRPAW
jgi:hypothetical protein